MRSTRITLLTLLFAAFILALPVFAQEATPELTTQTFASTNGSTTVSFPSDWVVKNTASADDTLSITLANSQAAMDTDLFTADEVFSPGEVHIEVAVIEITELAKSMPAGTITSNSTPLEILQALAKQGLPDTFTFGDPGAITINGNPAVRMNLKADKRGEGQLLLTIYDKKWIAGIILFAAPGEGDKWDIIARDIVASIHIDPDAKATPEPTLAPPPTQTYTSTAGNFTVTYPTVWEFVDRSSDTSANVVGGVFSSNHTTQFKQLYVDDFESGDVRIELSLPDLATFATFPQLADVNDKTPVTDILQGMVDAKIIPELKYGNVESSSLENATGAQVNVSGAGNGEGRLLLFKRLDGQFVYLVVYAASGELKAADMVARLIANSVAIPSRQPTVESTAEAFTLSQTAKTQNGLGSLSYPDKWFSRQFGNQSIYVSNSEAALNKSFGSVLNSGEVNILISVSSTQDYIDQAKLPVKADATPLELLQSTMKVVGDTIKFGAPEKTTVADKLAARVDFNGTGFEGTAWLIEYQKGALITVQLLTAPDEVEQWQPIALDIAESVRSTD